MSIGPDSASSDSTQVQPGPAAAGTDSSALPPSTPPLPQPSPTTLGKQQQPSTAASPITTTNTGNVVSTQPPQVSTPINVEQRPPPPASAISLQQAAAAKVSLMHPGTTVAKVNAPVSPSATLAAPANTPLTASMQDANNGTPGKKGGRAKGAKQTGSSTKPKQKRRSNQVGSKDDLVYQPGPSTAGGTIGAAADHTVPALLTAAGGGRKALPELVLPFQLPFTDVRPEMPTLDNASVQAAMAMGASETSSPDSGTDSDDYSVMSDESDLDSDAEESRRQARRRRREPATIEESLILLQSLRQSRLSHLSSLLTPFSQRVRSGMIYPNVLPLSLLHGLNPREPHVLIQLGRADIRVGPHVFVKTKFWEVRPDYELPPAMNATTRMHSFGRLPQPTLPPAMPQSIPTPKPMPQRPAEITSKPTLPAAPTPNSGPISIPKSTVVPASSTPAAAQPSSKPTTSVPTLPAAPVPASSTQRPTAPPTPTVPQVGPNAPLPAPTTSTIVSAAPPKPAIAASQPPVSAASTAKTIAVPVSLPRPPLSTPSLPRPPSLSQSNNAANSTPSTPSSQPVPFAPQRVSPPSAAVRPATAAPASSAAPSAPSSAAVPSAGGKVTSNTPTSSAARPGAPAPSPAQTRPPGPPPPPAIDAVLVSRVNATAALNPELQELLHVAAAGKASPTELKALGVWIQAITAQLREDEARNAAANGGAGGSSSASGARLSAASSSGAEVKKTKKSKVDEAAKAKQKQAKVEEREAKKKAKAEAKAKAAAEKQQNQNQKQKQRQQQQEHQQQQNQHHSSGKLPHPPPGWPTDGPPKPPVIIVEFRENPSMRFILPLWKCLVERTEGLERPSLPKIKKERRGFFDTDSDDEEPLKIEPELKLSFFAPSLGSDAADGSGLRELEEELKRKAAEEARLNASKSPPLVPSSVDSTDGGAASTTASQTRNESNRSSPTSSLNGSTVAGEEIGMKKKKVTGQKKGGKATRQDKMSANVMEDMQSKKHEIYPLTWTINGGVTESLWEAFGRVPGTMTCQPIKREPEIELEPDVAEFLVPEIRYRLLDLPMEEIKIQKETTETFVDLYSEMPDRRFIVPRLPPALLPQGLEDHLHDKFAVRPQTVHGRPVVKRKAGAKEDDVSFSYEGIGLTVIGPNGVKMEPGAGQPKPPKRKRHVATHNPDGTIKSCGACGKTKTPMWRRGPKGPSQLCNACGARWKAGRLVVPEVAPPPIIEAEEDRSKEEEGQREKESKGSSMHGSNALIIPQSSGMESDSYAMIGSTVLVGSGPYADGGSHSSGANGGRGGPYTLTEGKDGMDFGSATHLSRGSTSPSPFIRSPIQEDEVMPASVDPSMLSGSGRVSGRR